MLRFHRIEAEFRAKIWSAEVGGREWRSLYRGLYNELYSLIGNDNRISSDHRRGMKRIRAFYEAGGIAALGPPGLCLELGAGSGELCRALAGLGWRATGIDVVGSREWDRTSRESEGRARFQEAEVTGFDYPQEEFDLCILDNVLEHLPDRAYDLVVKKVFQTLKPGGWVLINLPNPINGPHDSSRFFLPPGHPATGAHLNERRLSRLKRDLEGSGFGGFKSVLTRGFASGRYWGWHRLWTWKALALERVLAKTPPGWRRRAWFDYLVPTILAGRKPG